MINLFLNRKDLRSKNKNNIFNVNITGINLLALEISIISCNFKFCGASEGKSVSLASRCCLKIRKVFVLRLLRVAIATNVTRTSQIATKSEVLRRLRYKKFDFKVMSSKPHYQLHVKLT